MDPGLAFVPADVKPAWTRQPPARAGYANVAEFLKKFSDAGGKIIVGTDAVCGGCDYIIPGLSLHYEMQMLVDLGIPQPAEIHAAFLQDPQRSEVLNVCHSCDLKLSQGFEIMLKCYHGGFWCIAFTPG